MRTGKGFEVYATKVERNVVTYFNKSESRQGARVSFKQSPAIGRLTLDLDLLIALEKP